MILNFANKLRILDIGSLGIKICKFVENFYFWFTLKFHDILFHHLLLVFRSPFFFLCSLLPLSFYFSFLFFSSFNLTFLFFLFGLIERYFPHIKLFSHLIYSISSNLIGSLWNKLLYCGIKLTFTWRRNCTHMAIVFKSSLKTYFIHRVFNAFNQILDRIDRLIPVKLILRIS